MTSKFKTIEVMDGDFIRVTTRVEVDSTGIIIDANRGWPELIGLRADSFKEVGK